MSKPIAVQPDIENRRVKVRCDKRRSFQVLAIFDGAAPGLCWHWAVSLLPSGRVFWTLTHVRSGLALFGCPSERAARKAALELAAVGNWDRPKKSIFGDRALCEAAMKVAKRWPKINDVQNGVATKTGDDE